MTHLNEEQLNAAADDEPLDTAVAEHLRICAVCGAQVQQLRALRAQLAALPTSIAITSEVWPRIRNTIHARQRRRRMFIGGAALALAAAVLFAVVRVLPSPEGPPNELAVAADVAELRGVVSPLVADAMVANLTVFDAALKELEAHAAAEGGSAELRQRIDDLRRKRAALLRLASNS